jgi:hypothetical protein
MSVKSGQNLALVFLTSHPTTRVPTDADALPTGALYVDGVADAATVTVTNITTGRYMAEVTLPPLAAGDMVAVVFSATVAGAAGQSVWQDIADTTVLSDGVTLADDAITAAKFDESTAFPQTAADVGPLVI